MNIIIESSIKTLQKASYLLDDLDDETLCNTSVSPYYSSIGGHIRHILDFYDCIFNMYEDKVDLTARSRNRNVESKCDCAKSYLKSIIDRLNSFNVSMDNNIDVYDDLGLGKIKMNYTFGALFSQANSHTIHHYAIINYILQGLNIHFEDSHFGYNPTTPQEIQGK